MADWQKLKKEYVKGGVSYRQLAEKYRVSFSQLQKIAAKEKWRDLRKKTERKAEEKMVDSISDQRAEFSEKIYEAADILLEKLIKQVEKSIMIPAPAMRQYTASLKDLKDIKDIRSDADLREQEARIAKLEREAAAEDRSTKEIEITFSAGEEEWNE